MRLLLGGLAALAPSAALAGAWSMPQGETQAIAKIEVMRADQGFDLDGALRDLPAPREDDIASLFVEYGLTRTLTLQLKAEWQRGLDAFADYEGTGPTEIGVRWQAWRDDHNAVALYVGYATPGEGRNAGYAAPGEGEGDWEVRALAGHSDTFDWLGGRRAFIEVQGARRFRSGLPDEARGDLAFGIESHDGRWLALSQLFGGQTLDGGEAMWLNSETSIVRRLGDWSVQAGWREAVLGREAPAQRGLVFAVWRRF